MSRFLARCVPRLAFMVYLVSGVLCVHELWRTDFQFVLHDADWVMFQDTARLLWSGRLNEIYPGITKDSPFFYPPYLIPWIAPLGGLSRAGGYAACVLSMSAAMASALWALRRTLPAEGPSYTDGIHVALSTVSWGAMILLGHLSAIYLLAAAGGLWLWSRDRHTPAGAVLSLLMFKPQLGLVFPLIFIARRQWSLLAGWVGGCCLLLLATWPLGTEIWVHYGQTSHLVASLVTTQIPMEKQQTIYAFWRTLLDTPQTPQVVALWLVSILPLVILAVIAWLKTPLDRRRLPRLFGVTLLTLSSCNIYLFVYDNILLLLPGLVWYMDRGSYRSGRCRAMIGGAMAIAYLWQHLNLWGLNGGVTGVGPAVGVWLLFECWDLLGGTLVSTGNEHVGPTTCP